MKVLRALLLVVLVSAEIGQARPQFLFSQGTAAGEFVSNNYKELYFISHATAQRKLIAVSKHPKCSFSVHEISAHSIVVSACDRRQMVLDETGKLKYELPQFQFPYYITNQQETFFAVCERGQSLWHQLKWKEDYDRMRLLVYSMDHGKKIFEYRWKSEPGENVSAFGTVYFSPDGKTVYLVRDLADKVLQRSFVIP